MTRCLHTLTACWRRTPWQAVLLLFAVPFLIRNLLLPMVADDFSYAFIWNGDDLGNLMDNIGPRERIDSFYDILISQWSHYFTWGGRTPSMIFIQLFAWLGKIWFDLAIYQVLELILPSVICVIGQLVAIILGIWLFAVYQPLHIWWGFPVACFLFLIGQLLLSFLYSRRQGCRVSALTQIPYSEGGRTSDCSVRYQPDEVHTVVRNIDTFLQKSKHSEHDIFCLNLCCEELITNIVQHSQGHIVLHSFDVHIYSDDEGTCVALKDGGKPFNPLLVGKMSEPNIDKEDSEHLGLRLVNNLVENISYKYMYGLNIVLIKI